jgi:hypothetical protein
MPPSVPTAITIAEQMMAVLDRGSYTTTYKYSVLLALLDLCLEHTERDGAAPTSLTTRQIALRVLELYWPQVAPFPFGSSGKTDLVQTRGRPTQQAVIVARTRALRDLAIENGAGRSPSTDKARSLCPDEFTRAVNEIEWTLIRYPLVLLQTIGGENVPFLYQLSWDENVSKREVNQYQTGRTSTFHNLVQLMPGVGESLVQLNNLLRPLIHREWSMTVADINRLPEMELQRHLFGADRVDLTPLLQPLLRLQNEKCFYCDLPIPGKAHVDHFLPWARYPANGLENLVATHERCNNSKSDFLAAPSHVLNWANRMRTMQRELSDISNDKRWTYRPMETTNVARAIYLRLPEHSRLWIGAKRFEGANTVQLREALKDGPTGC